MKRICLAFAVLLPLAFSSCGSSGGGAAATYSVGGTVTGLSGTLVLQNNLANDLTVAADGAFTFTTKLANAVNYSVTVLTQPDTRTCTVASGSGVVSSANVTNVTVTCTAAYSVGGTISGLSGTVVLQNNLADDLTITADGTFTFTTKLADAATYSVTVLTQPATKICSVTSGSGPISGANVTSVAVTCASPIIFVTDSVMAGDIGSIANADLMCTNDENYPGSGTYKAMIDDGATRTATVDWVLAADMTYTRTDGTVIGTTNASATFDFDITSPIDPAGGVTWTGLNYNWTSEVNNCLAWTSASVTEHGSVGRADAVDSNLITSTTAQCDQSKYLYCVQQIE